MNPFIKLQQAMQHSRHGVAASDALRLLAPYWAAEWSNTGKTTKGDIIAKLNTYENSKLVREMKSLINSLPI